MAVSNVSLQIHPNEIFGTLGVNRAGKTTLVECIEGLRKPLSGKVTICGFDPIKDRDDVTQRVGVQLQNTAYPDKAKVFEICELFSAMYSHPLDGDDLLQRMGLFEKRKAYVSQLSGGQKQRLSIVLALLSNPKVLFLDELTTGLDPKARHQIWDVIKDLKSRGMTIVLISHFMDEVELLCDRIAIMDKGKMVAVGTVSEIMNQCNLEKKLTVHVSNVIHVKEMEDLEGVTSVHQQGNQLTIQGKDEAFWSTIIKYFDVNHVKYTGLEISSFSLEDAFLKLTAHSKMTENEDEV